VAENFELVTRPLSEIGERQMLVRNEYLSVEPAMRGWASAVANYATPVGHRASDARLFRRYRRRFPSSELS
jgi:NADPH-dependent curcumin reductase CurA